MRTSDKGIALIKHYESFRARAYVDAVGVLTIGYGTTAGVRSGMVITESQASNMLLADCAKFEREITNHVKVPLSQNQFDALVAFVYNVGPGNFQSSTLLKVLNQGHYDQVPAQMMRWNKGNGVVLNGLTRRRTSEGHLFATGQLDF